MQTATAYRTAYNLAYVFSTLPEPVNWSRAAFAPSHERHSHRRKAKATYHAPLAVPAIPASPFIHRPDLHIRAGVCGMVAIAYSANITKAEAVKAYNKVNGTRQRSATSQAGILLTLKALKVKMEGVASNGCTLSHFANELATPGRLYMVRTPRHVQMVKDGWVFDQCGPCPMAKSAHRNLRTSLIIEISE